jgi:hypothetical protein
VRSALTGWHDRRVATLFLLHSLAGPAGAPCQVVCLPVGKGAQLARGDVPSPARPRVDGPGRVGRGPLALAGERLS